jgi:hypothetical protein
METSIASLSATVRTKTFAAEKAPRSDRWGRRERAVFALRREVTQFAAAWGGATTTRHRLLVEPDLFHALNLSPGEPVEVLV